MLGIGGGKTPFDDIGDDTLFNCKLGKPGENSGPEITAASCVPGLEVAVGPLADPGPEATPSAIPTCVCWGGCCREVGGGETLVNRDVYI